jgi:hypothetical protein
MTMQVTIQGRHASVNGHAVDLPHEVVQQLPLDGLVLLRVEPPPGQVFNRNVFAFDAAAQRLWQIAESPHGTEADKPFMGLRVDARGRVIASSWNGVDYVVDLGSGALQACGFGK